MMLAIAKGLAVQAGRGKPGRGKRGRGKCLVQAQARRIPVRHRAQRKKGQPEGHPFSAFDTSDA